MHVGNVAGFQSCTLPEASTEATEYREGIYKFTKKFPGVPTFTDVTLMRGIVPTDTGFHDWAITAMTGGEYRSHVRILHYQRGDITPGTDEAVPGTAAREYQCFECFPIRAKPAADLEAMTGEVSMGEMDFSLEYFTIGTA